MTNSKDIFNALKSGKLSVEDAQRELIKNEPESFSDKSFEVAENLLFFGEENRIKSDKDRIFSNLYEITIENNICLREHLVYNQYIMPTDAFIEMVYVGAKKLLGFSCVELEKIYISNPLIGFEGQTIIVNLSFIKKNNSYRFVISSKYADSTDGFMQNVRGIIREIPLTLSKNSEYKSYITDYNDLIKGSIYNAELGPFYQTIKEIKVKKNVAISHPELSSEGKKLKTDFLMNPSIADGAMLTSLIFAGFLAGDHKKNVFLPVQIESLKLYKKIEKDNYFCFVRLKEIKPEWTVFDVELIDEQYDEVILSFKGLKVKNFDRSMIDRSVENATKKFNTKIMKKTFIEKNADSYKKYNNANRDIAVIGISCKFPDADNAEEFWHNLAQGKDSVIEVPKDRWNIDDYFDSDPEVPKTTYCKWGGFLNEIDKFDPLFFNISPFEATFMDPQQRLFLQESWKAIEDAGYSSSTLSGKKCGMFVGVGTGDYQNLPHEINAHYFMGISNSILSARLSYFLNLTGTALSIDTACSSSLVAIHQGCQSILNGENEMALAGGVHIMTTPLLYIMASKAGMLSYIGKCRTFDNQADGFVPGEGVGVLVLKPLKKAVEDGDNIYGVIKGSSTNQDGKTNGITAPSSNSQIRLEKELYEKCGISPESISFVETHGTGTKLGDPIEVAALRESFKAYTAKKHFCALGSVKTNIGHTATAAGVASVIKVLLALKHKQIPPSLNFEKANEHINFQDSPFYVNTKLTDWKPADNAPLRAAVSSFGFSGTNAHVVLEEYPEKLRITNYEPVNRSFLFCQPKMKKGLRFMHRIWWSFWKRGKDRCLVIVMSLS
jgi:3-oxoacyl-(acyl-carrier-protein) synthase